MLLAEPRYVVDQAQPAHLSSDNLQNSSATAIPVSHPIQRLQVLAVSIFQLDENGQTELLVTFVAGEKQLRKFIEGLNTTDPVEAEFDLRTTFHVYPALFDQDNALQGESPAPGLVKRLRCPLPRFLEIAVHRKPCESGPTLLFEATSPTSTPLENWSQTIDAAWDTRFLRRAIPFTISDPVIHPPSHRSLVEEY